MTEGRRGQPASAAARAVALLARREHSERELRRKLEEREFGPEEIDEAVTLLQSQALQSDLRFAEMLLRTRVAAGCGPLRLAAEWSQHGIDGGTQSHVLEQAGIDWSDLAVEALQRRFGSVPEADARSRRRCIDFLLRRGFDAETAYAALRRLA
jgi:regulatory protein